jgi:hypothetical protein
MKTFVGIRFEVEGFHNYPDASKNHGELVKFLEQSHRHIFKFNCKKRVNHDNRDEEFILLRRKVKRYINQNFPVFESSCECYDFGSMSCEMIAKKILKQFDFDSVEVSEDGENYAIVEKEECDNIKQEKEDNNKLPLVTFVVGKAFSGKSYYVNEKVKEVRGVIVEVGEIVRKIKQEEKRIFEGFLSKEIAKRTFHILTKVTSDAHVYIVGCRQKSVIEQISYLCELNHLHLDYNIIYLSASNERRKERFEKLVDKEKNKGLTFEEIENGDESLGINELITWCIDQPNCLIIRTEEV